VPTALLIANGTQAATYNALGNAFAAAAPVDGYGQQADAWQTETESYALFTHNQIKLNEKAMLTLGLRYNHEEKKLAGNLNSIQPSCDVLRSASVLPIATAILAAQPPAQSLFTLTCSPALNTLQNGVYADKVTDDEFTGIASLSAKINPETLIYGSYSRGYKAGGFNLDRSAFSVLPLTTVKRTSDDLQFDPEFVNAFEAGVKYTLGRMATFNATAFYEDISDYQLNEFAGFNFQTRNIPKVVSKGVELETSVKPMDGVTLNGGAVYNEAYFDSPVTFGTETLRQGTVLRQAPKYVATGSITVERPVTDSLNAVFYLDGRWNSKYRTQTINRVPQTDNKAYALFNARVGLNNGKGWGVELFAQNLLDENYFAGGFNPPEQSGTWGVYPGVPRTWGVSLKSEF
jgi:outer membrane receptor protein involved in Fe transport